MALKLLRIVPRENPDGGPHLTQGTKVLMPDGTPVPGITKIVITGLTNDVFRADISCHVTLPEITCMASVATEWAPSRWRRFLWWIWYDREWSRRRTQA